MKVNHAPTSVGEEPRGTTGSGERLEPNWFLNLSFDASWISLLLCMGIMVWQLVGPGRERRLARRAHRAGRGCKMYILCNTIADAIPCRELRIGVRDVSQDSELVWPFNWCCIAPSRVLMQAPRKRKARARDWTGYRVRPCWLDSRGQPVEAHIQVVSPWSSWLSTPWLAHPCCPAPPTAQRCRSWSSRHAKWHLELRSVSRLSWVVGQSFVYPLAGALG